MKRQRTAVFLVLLAIVAGACSRTSRVAGESGPAGGAASATPSTGKVGPPGEGAFNSALGTPSPNPAASASPAINAQRSCQAVRYQSAASGVPGGTYIFADASPQMAWGAKCRLFAVGDECQVTFSGSYSAPGDRAYLEWQAWLPKGSSPSATKLIGPVAAANGRFENWKFPFTVPRVSAVLFRIVLLNDAKVEIADGDSWVYQVGCR